MSRNHDKGKLIIQGADFEMYEVHTNSSSESRRVKKITSLPTGLDTLDGSDMEKLSKEVRDQARLCDLRHKNLVQLFGITLDSNEFKLIVEMEWMKGQSLEKRITDARELSVKDAIARGLPEKDVRLYSKQICSALDYLHENNVLHRDINGNTVMITHNNVVKLIDFGISIQLLDDASRKATGCLRGEPQFMAPELCVLDESQGGFMHSRGSDIWAFGCLVFYMVTGKRPLAECRNMMAIVRRICDEEPPGLPDTCSSALKRFHQRCMTKNRINRMSAGGLLGHEFLAPS